MTAHITYAESAAYIGRECLTSRIVSVIQAMQITNLVSTIVHFGNPFVLEELEHISRILIGSTSKERTRCALDVLAGKYPAKGHLTYELHLKRTTPDRNFLSGAFIIDISGCRNCSSQNFPEAFRHG